MSISVLSSAGRFNAGSELWITPPAEFSSVISEIDWYLNFQISQNIARDKRRRPEPLNTILSEIDWDFPSAPTEKNSPLMISAEQSLPCRWVVLLFGCESIQSWTKDLFELWTNMNKPSLRVFLPKNIPSADWISLWRTHSSFEDLSVVLDSSEK